MAEPTVNQLVATTLANYHKQFADNVANSNAITALLREGNRIRMVDGGRSINCPLTYAEETFSWYMGTELLSRAVKETISEADYEPANAVASVTLSGPDLAKNRGRERILNLLEGKMDNAESTMKNNITKAIYGDGTVAKSFAGLKAFVTNDGTGIVGGIDAKHMDLLEEPVPDRHAADRRPPVRRPQGGDERPVAQADPWHRASRPRRRGWRNLRHLRGRASGTAALRRRQAGRPRASKP